MTNLKKIFLGLLMIILGLTSVYAITTPNGAGKVVGATGQYNSTSATSINAQGGNVTGVNLSSNASSTKWQAFYGNVSGNIILGSGNNVFYTFPTAQFNTVIATQNASINWTSLAASTSAEVDTAWGFNTASNTDQATDFYNTTGTFAGVAGIPSAIINNGLRTGVMETVSNATAKGHFAFVSNVNNTGAVGFGGNSYQYEMMVPVGPTPEVYNIYLSLT